MRSLVVALLVSTLLGACSGDGRSEPADTSTSPASTVPASSVPASTSPAASVPGTPSTPPASGSADSGGTGARQLELAGATPEQIACFEQRLEAATRQAEAGGGFEPLTVALECLPKPVLIAGERLDLERTGASAEAIDCVVSALSAGSDAEVRQLVAGVTSASVRQRCGLPG